MKKKSSVDVCNLIPDAIGSRTSFVLSFITQSSISLFFLFSLPVHLAMLFFSFHLPTLIHLSPSREKKKYKHSSLCVRFHRSTCRQFCWVAIFSSLIGWSVLLLLLLMHLAQHLPHLIALCSGTLSLASFRRPIESWRSLNHFFSFVCVCVPVATVDHSNCTCNCLKVQLTAFRPAPGERETCSHRKRERTKKE